MAQIDLKEDLTGEEFAAWLPPKFAVRMLIDRNGWSDDQAIRALLKRLAASIVRAAAAHIVYKPNGRTEERRYRRFIPYTHWEPDSQWLIHSDFWDTGDITFDVLGGSNTNAYSIKVVGHISFFDVRFDPADVEAMTAHSQVKTPVPLPSLPPSAAQQQPNRGGRPPKAYWEPLLIEMARQLYAGELQPKRQADIEEAMHIWLSANGHAAGETQVRERARKLWQTIEK